MYMYVQDTLLKNPAKLSITRVYIDKLHSQELCTIENFLFSVSEKLRTTHAWDPRPHVLALFFFSV